MPRAGARAGATGDAGGAAGSKVRSTEAPTNTRECPRYRSAPRRLLISVSRIGRDGGKMRPPRTQSVSQNAKFDVQPSSNFADPPVVWILLN